MNNNFGLNNKNLNLIISALKSYSNIKHVYIFGSRAMGNYKPGSDIDLALEGNIDQSLQLLDSLKQISIKQGLKHWEKKLTNVISDLNESVNKWKSLIDTNKDYLDRIQQSNLIEYIIQAKGLRFDG